MHLSLSYKNYFIWGVAALFVLTLLPKFLCPINEPDGSWYFSQAASVWQGSILKTHFVDEVMELGYGIVQLPFAHPALGHYGLIVFHAAFWCLLAYSLYSLLGNRSIATTLLIALLLIDKTVLLQRTETISLTLALFTYVLHTRYGNTIILILGALVLIILHPANGVLCILGYLTYQNQLFKPNRNYLYIYLGGIALGVLILFLFQDTVYVGYFMYRASSVSSGPFLQFMMYSGVSVAALVILTLSKWPPLFWANYLVLFTLALLISPYYYFLLLLFPLILLCTKYLHHTKYTNYILIALLGLNIMTNLIHPIFVQLENTAYGSTIKQNLNHLNQDWESIHSENIFISSELGSAVFTQTPKAKMLLFYDGKVSGLKNVMPNDMGYAYTTTQKDILINTLMQESRNYSIEELQPAVKGKLSIKSLYRARTDSVGLWKFTF